MIEKAPYGNIVKTWSEFSREDPELSSSGMEMLFKTRIGRAFLATLRKDGAPRLHPVSLFVSNGRLYMGIPHTSPKCKDLLRDGRYALQAFPISDGKDRQFYLAGSVEAVYDPLIRMEIVKETMFDFQNDEILFELKLQRAMYTELENPGTPEERPKHRKWRSINS